MGHVQIDAVNLQRVALPSRTARGAEPESEIGAVVTDILGLHPIGIVQELETSLAIIVEVAIAGIIEHTRVKRHGSRFNELNAHGAFFVDRNGIRVHTARFGGGVDRLIASRHNGLVAASERHLEAERFALCCSLGEADNLVTIHAILTRGGVVDAYAVAKLLIVQIDGLVPFEQNARERIFFESIVHVAVVMHFGIRDGYVIRTDGSVEEIVAVLLGSHRLEHAGRYGGFLFVRYLVLRVVITNGDRQLQVSIQQHRHLGRSASVLCRCGSFVCRGLLNRSLNRARLNLHRQRIGHLVGCNLVLAVRVGRELGLDAVDGCLDFINLPALGGLGGELQFLVRGDIDRLGVVADLFPVIGDGGAVRQIQLDGSKLILLGRRRRLGLGLGAQNRVGRGVRGGGFGCRLGRRLDGLDHGLFGCLRAVGRRGLIRRSRRLIGHGGACRLRSGGLHAGVVHRRGDILARLLVGQRAACERRRAHHLRGEQDRQDDRRRLDAEIPPSSQNSTVGPHKTPPTFSAAISRGSSSPDHAAPCVPTWEPNFHSGIPAQGFRSSSIRRRTPTRRVKIITSIFTTNTHPGFSAKNELGRQRNECIPDRCYFLTFRNERGVSGHQCGNRAAAPRNECRRRGIDIPANGTSTSPLTGFRYFY